MQARIALFGAVAWLAGAVAAAQIPQILRSSAPTAGGEFGRSVAVNGEFAAVASRDRTLSPSGQFIDGRITLFRRSASGEWVPHEILRNPNFHAGYDARQLEFRGDSIFTTFGGVDHFERVGGAWHYVESIGRTDAFALGGSIRHIGTDGQTLMGGVGTIVDPAVFFFERGTQGWTLVTTLRQSQFSFTPCVGGAVWGTALEVEGDVAVTAALGHCVPPNANVGRVYVLRRVNGTWVQEQTIDYPGTPTQNNLYFGAECAVWGDELFVGCSGEGSVYVYRHDPASGWAFESRIQPTAAPGQDVLGGGAFGISVEYVPPTLVVGASTLRAPGGVPGAPVFGAGTIFAFERCGDLWNQRTVMAAPPAWGTRGIGQFMGSDGMTVVTGSPYVQFPDPITGNPVIAGGAAAVATLQPPSSSTECVEIGRVVCTPADPAMTACPCTTPPVEPGRGCPNSTGRGARLYCHGGFDQHAIDRVLVENLPPGAIVLLAIGTPSPAPHTGVIVGGGVSCLGPVLLRTVGQADASGSFMLDDVPTLPWSILSGTFGFLLPIQVIYRDPAGACNATWNATNAVAFSLSV